MRFCLVASVLAGCGESKSAADKAAPPPTPPTVVVAEVVQRTVPIRSEFVARTDARDTVEIRARVQAFLEALHFTEGTMVKKDQVLFTLDKREFEAQLKQGRAQLAKAQADLAFAKDQATVDTAKANLDVALAFLNKADTDVRRLKPLAEQRAVPQMDYDNALAGQQGARADVQSKKAALETARVNQTSSIEQAAAAIEAANATITQAELNISYCTIRSPIDGLIGKREVAPGNLVGRGEATLLATVSSLDPLRVYLSVSEADYLRFRRRARRATRGPRPPSSCSWPTAPYSRTRAGSSSPTAPSTWPPVPCRSSPSFRTPTCWCAPVSSAARGWPWRTGPTPSSCPSARCRKSRDCRACSWWEGTTPSPSGPSPRPRAWASLSS